MAESLEDAIKKTEQSNAGSPKKQMLTKRVTFMILEPPSSSERVFMINKIKKNNKNYAFSIYYSHKNR